jgi:hypothetical protein
VLQCALGDSSLMKITIVFPNPVNVISKTKFVIMVNVIKKFVPKELSWMKKENTVSL